jgi:hypothetical protein
MQSGRLNVREVATTNVFSWAGHCLSSIGGTRFDPATMPRITALR